MKEKEKSSCVGETGVEERVRSEVEYTMPKLQLPSPPCCIWTYRNEIPIDRARPHPSNAAADLGGLGQVHPEKREKGLARSMGISLPFVHMVFLARVPPVRRGPVAHLSGG